MKRKIFIILTVYLLSLLITSLSLVYADGYPYDLIGKAYASSAISNGAAVTVESGVMAAYKRTNGDKILKARVWSREGNVRKALGGDWIYTTQVKIAVKDNGTNPIYFWIYDASPAPITTTSFLPAIAFDIMSIYSIPTSVLSAICNGQYAKVAHTDNTNSYEVAIANSGDLVMDLSNTIPWYDADAKTTNNRSGASAEFLYNCAQSKYPVQFSGIVSYRLKSWVDGNYYRTFYADSSRMVINKTIN